MIISDCPDTCVSRIAQKMRHLPRGRGKIGIEAWHHADARLHREDTNIPDSEEGSIVPSEAGSLQMVDLYQFVADAGTANRLAALCGSHGPYIHTGTIEKGSWRER
jgi:hypothetical protein